MSARSARILLLAVLTLCSGMLASAAAQEATPAGTPVGGVTVLPPDADYAGVSRGEWSARFNQWAFSLPPEGNPNLDPTGARCSYGQSGPVFFLPAAFAPEPYERTCVVPAGAAIFVIVGGVGCSTLEPPPYFGRDEAELRACAEGQAGAVPHQVAIDGQEVADIDAYQTTTSPYTLTLAEGNLLGLPAGVGLAVSVSNSILIAPPEPGAYAITVTADFTGVGGEVLTGTTHVIVEAPRVIEPAATPAAGAAEASPGAAVACTTPPRDVAEIEALWVSVDGTPVADPNVPPPMLSMADLPAGEPVDADTVAVIEDVVHQAWACSPVDTLRFFALYTDDFIRRAAPPAAEREMALAGIQVTPAPDEVLPPATVSDASEARRLPDGRVGALFTITHEDGFGAMLFVILEQQPDGRWLIDEEIPVR